MGKCSMVCFEAFYISVFLRSFHTTGGRRGAPGYPYRFFLAVMPVNGCYLSSEQTGCFPVADRPARQLIPLLHNNRAVGPVLQKHQELVELPQSYKMNFKLLLLSIRVKYFLPAVLPSLRWLPG